MIVKIFCENLFNSQKNKNLSNVTGILNYRGLSNRYNRMFFWLHKRVQMGELWRSASSVSLNFTSEDGLLQWQYFAVLGWFHILHAQRDPRFDGVLPTKGLRYIKYLDILSTISDLPNCAFQYHVIKLTG